jgi:hypothetical protein
MNIKVGGVTTTKSIGTSAVPSDQFRLGFQGYDNNSVVQFCLVHPAATWTPTQADAIHNAMSM